MKMTEKAPNILVVDDEKGMCELLDDTLTGEGYHVQAIDNPRKAIEVVRSNDVDIVLLDLVMPQIGGIDVLREIKRIKPDTVVIIMTGYGTVDTAVEAMKLGAYDYITKPFRMSKIKTLIARILEGERIVQENVHLREQLKKRYRFDNIIGNSPKMQEVYNMIEKVASSDCNVLIQGASGTGKELIARAIHYNSPRKDKPFIAHSCAVLPENLLESELFGHVKGAFTGAIRTKHGLLEVAEGGTFFLDEIGCVSPPIQAKLLRVIEEREFKKVGGIEPVKVDIRLIAATNRNLKEAVEEGTFRDDLFYRLNVVTIFVPPLTERKQDIPLLANYFLDKYNISSKKDTKSISPTAMDMLLAYDWPGNVRELENIVERAVVLQQGDTILPQDLPLEMRTTTPGTTHQNESLSLPATVREAEKQKITEALEQTTWRKEKAAKLLGISRKTLWQKMKAYDIH
jgi:DNA-binding NtrC family response regulator